MKERALLMMGIVSVVALVAVITLVTTSPRLPERKQKRAAADFVLMGENGFDFDEGPHEEELEEEEEEELIDAAGVANHVVRTIDNRGGGDCLFHCFRQAVAMTTGKQLTIGQLRKAVADSMTETVLEDLRTVYNGASDTQDSSLLRDFGFMEGVTNLEELRDVVQTPTYWGDELALPALERATGLRAVVVLGDGAIPRIAARFDVPVSDRIIFVRLRRFHYELIEVDGRVVFGAESFKHPLGK